MLAALVVLLRSLALLCCGHRAVALENLALRQQLAVLRRTAKRPPLRHRDRLFWILLANAWRDWRTALIVVQPDTVVCRVTIAAPSSPLTDPSVQDYRTRFFMQGSPDSPKGDRCAGEATDGGPTGARSRARAASFRVSAG